MSLELILFQENHVTTRAAAAKRLRELADKIESLSFMMGDHQVNLPETVDLQIELDPEDEFGGELEIEILWQPWEKMPPTRFATEEDED
jgi:hypothetical protein